MTVKPVLLDSRPSYLRGDDGSGSLLLMPLGAGTVLGWFASRLPAANSGDLTVLSTFVPSAEYECSIRKAYPAVEAVCGATEFGDCVADHEPSDWLLIADPRWCPETGFDPGPLLGNLMDERRWVRHQVLLEATATGTGEFVLFDEKGAVRRVQRYYDAVTWPFAGGVSCSLVPVSAILMTRGLSFASLAELRKTLAAQGVPSRDVALPPGVLDLATEGGLLALSERVILDSASSAAADGRSRLSAGSERGPDAGCRIDPSARILDPVILNEGVVIAERAVVVGPAVLGAGSRVGRQAVVAQCLLGPEAVIPPGMTVRHRVITAGPAGEALDPAQGANADHPFPGLSRGRGAVPLQLREAPRRLYPEIKRLVEGAISLFALLLLSPLLGVVALLVKLGSRGPVLYADHREGRDGELFRCWKFRTMVEGADVQQRVLLGRSVVDGPQFKLKGDPRLTAVGRWLRPTSLDELPQLINVVAGEMSLVGPRPSPFRENQVCVPWRQGRLSVRPGITGLWQVCRHDRSKGDFDQWIYYDLLYVRHMSFWLDLKILAATLLTLGGRGRVPLSWLLPPHKYDNRRRSSRESRFSPTDLIRSS